MSRLDPLLKRLSEAPPAQIHEQVTKKIGRLIGCPDEIVVTELKEIQAECKRYPTLATPFALEIIAQAIEVAQIRDV